MTTVELSSIKEVDCQQWRELSRNAPMRSPEWMLGWWKHFREADWELFVLFVYESQASGNQRLIGVAPLYRAGAGSQQVLRLLGGSGDVCTDHTTWFSEPGYETRVGKEVADYLRTELHWRRLELDSVDCDDPALAACCESLVTGEYFVHRKPTVSTWSIPVPPTWDDYLATLSKSHRKRCRRLCRTWFDSGRAVLHEANSESFDQVLDVFLKLHRDRWGDERRPEGSFSDPHFRDFHMEISRTLFERGQVRLSYLAIDDKPYAAEYQFYDEDTLYAYQSGMAKHDGGAQPGNLSLIASLQFCIERGLKHMDLLRGDEPYKAHWRAAPTPCETVRLWPKSVAGQIEFGYQGLRSLAAQMLK